MNTKIIKIASLGLLTGIFSFLSFYLLNTNLIAGEIGSVWPVIISFWVFLVLIVLETIFIRDYYLLIGFVFTQSLITILAFSRFLGHLNFIIVGVTVLFLFSIWGVKKGYETLKNNIEFRFFFTSHRIVPKIVTGILLFVFIALYFNYIALGNFTNEMANRMFDGFIKSIEPIVKVWTPAITFDMKINEALKKASLAQLERSKIELLTQQDINLNEISEETKNQLVNETALELQSRIENITGKLDKDETIRGALFSFFEKKVKAMSPLAKKVSGGGILMIMFFTIKGIALLTYPFIEFTAFLIYKILNLLGFTYITLEEKRKEVVNI